MSVCGTQLSSLHVLQFVWGFFSYFVSQLGMPSSAETEARMVTERQLRLYPVHYAYTLHLQSALHSPSLLCYGATGGRTTRITTLTGIPVLGTSYSIVI